MTKRSTAAEKPAQKQHRGRMGCLVVIGVVMLVVVGTVFAPDRSRQAAQPTASPTPDLTLMLTVEPASTELSETAPSISKTISVMTLTRTRPNATGTLEGTMATQSATPSPTRTAAASPTLTRTSTPIATPTIGLILATNTHPPLVIVTNTPSR